VHAAIKRFEVWLKGFCCSDQRRCGRSPGLAAVGIDTPHFNLQAGIGSTMRTGLAAAVINSVIGVTAYLMLLIKLDLRMTMASDRPQ
jgi:hypothetical protein